MAVGVERRVASRTEGKEGRYISVVQDRQWRRRRVAEVEADDEQEGEVEI